MILVMLPLETLLKLLTIRSNNVEHSFGKKIAKPIPGVLRSIISLDEGKNF